VPDVQERLRFACGSSGRLTLEIYRGGRQADVTIGGQTFLVLQRPNPLFPYSFQAGDGSRLRGTANLVEWRWPDGRRVNCIG
jgi:hypothetical protein